MLKFEQYLDKINEEATANASTAGMGAVVSAQVGSVPGAAYTGNGTTGSGDIATTLFKPFEQKPAALVNNFTNFKKNRIKRKRKSK